MTEMNTQRFLWIKAENLAGITNWRGELIDELLVALKQAVGYVHHVEGFHPESPIGRFRERYKGLFDE